ncbi:MAG: hypothetical protein UX87_C0018G0011 [Candidatus Amesbacteria bacterium GW2011_GWA1_47_16]|uniref:Uncharacterized protein n=4 Tax=Candidatus Amesiibacteriota TaxID=1752730 RepID=A0A1F4ZVW5_9BACT|nr:MAG: hypothetical protein UX86_C0019G0016 [Candidatus Amesbacteria bacterium GW2011_GWC1_47_15]KKU63762.1 MAG: hypothetical protein UX87_C0018G0011 [Candidatus Amesbacteria bacterium GW2011_GWA1_47_16]KKU97939.1 MAG: hypothetical protein UY28_C0011G0029 [Candidatus Amesbacteria bacterium GW2011_GWB1_48_13]OGD09597.1 MAG: hypothetical protein A2395_01280 [Candidatus Amesbacteria bacterium RIFOXYB1_FULL_47_9]
MAETEIEILTGCPERVRVCGPQKLIAPEKGERAFLCEACGVALKYDIDLPEGKIEPGKQVGRVVGWCGRLKKEFETPILWIDVGSRTG